MLTINEPNLEKILKRALSIIEWLEDIKNCSANAGMALEEAELIVTEIKQIKEALL
jgi:hypothetical protein